MEKTGFQTSRLIVEPWSKHLVNPNTVSALAAELTPVLTPTVLKHLPPAFWVESQSSAIVPWIHAREAECDVMTIRERNGGALIGLVILAEFVETGVGLTVQMGYLFQEQSWGKGYATEMLSGLVGMYKTGDHPVDLRGGVELENAASARVLEKVGFQIVAEETDQTNAMYRLQLNERV